MVRLSRGSGEAPRAPAVAWVAGAGARGLVAAALLTLGGALPVFAQTSAQTASACAAGQVPQFVLGFADLKQRLGTRMGDPVDCQHTDPSTGDTLQHTSTGLAYDRAGSAAASFTNGWEHYALLNDQVLLWRNTAASPPQATTDQVAYMQQTLALRTQLDQINEQLIAIERQGRVGELDNVDQTDLGTAVNELTSIGDQLTSTPTPADLMPYAQQWVEIQQGDLAAATALIQARVTQVPDERALNLADAATQIQVRNEAREASTLTLSQLLPVTYTPVTSLT